MIVPVIIFLLVVFYVSKRGGDVAIKKDYTFDTKNKFDSIENRKLLINTSAGSEGGTGKIYVEGTIDLPAELKKLLESKSKVALTIFWYGLDPSLLPKKMEFISNPKFPYHYRLELDPQISAYFKGNSKLLLNSEVAVAYDYSDLSQVKIDAPRPFLEAFTEYYVEKMVDTEKLNGEIKVPLTVINHNMRAVNKQDCDLSGGTISGKLLPNPRMLSTLEKKSKFLLMLVPTANLWPIPKDPLVYSGMEPLKDYKLPNTNLLDDAGLSYKFLTVEGPEGAAFQFKIDQKFKYSRFFGLYARACKLGEPEQKCLERAFPIPRSISPFSGPVSPEHYMVVGQNFETALCGMKDHIFYLNHVDSKTPPSDGKNIVTANPPELIEGISYY